MRLKHRLEEIEHRLSVNRPALVVLLWQPDPTDPATVAPDVFSVSRHLVAYFPGAADARTREKILKTLRATFHDPAPVGWMFAVLEMDGTPGDLARLRELVGPNSRDEGSA